MVDLNEAIKVEMSPDYMYARVTIVTVRHQEITAEDIMTRLAEQDIKMGIDSARIQRMLDEREFYKAVLVASGRAAQNGRDGYFEFFFDTEYKCGFQPTEEGSVDFSESSLFCHVKKGDVLARYIPPTIGSFGYDIRGKLLKPRKGRSLATLKGSGFNISKDGRVYFAGMNGRIVYKNGHIEISEINQHWGNVDYIMSNMKCAGDVRIHGNVAGGMLIEASGSVEIDGYVGAATIVSGGDVLIKGGMKGRGKGKVQAAGCVLGKYFEDVGVHCDGDVHTNYFLNCDVYSRGTVHIDGAHGTIIGGMCHGVNGIQSENAGNDAGKVTALRLGVTEEVLHRFMETKHQIELINKDIDSVNAGLERLEEGRNGAALEPEGQETFNRLFQTKILKVAECKQLENEREALQELVDNAAKAEIIIHNTLHEGVSILTGKNSQAVSSNRSGVRIYVRRGEVVMEKIYRS